MENPRKKWNYSEISKRQGIFFLNCYHFSILSDRHDDDDDDDDDDYEKKLQVNV